jgi:hypothetical protein
VVELRKLLDFEAKSGKVSKYPPILYPKHVRKAGTRHGYQKTLFQSEIIFKVCVLVSIMEDSDTYLLYTLCSVHEGVFVWCRVTQVDKAGWSTSIRQGLEDQWHRRPTVLCTGGLCFFGMFILHFVAEF